MPLVSWELLYLYIISKWRIFWYVSLSCQILLSLQSSEYLRLLWCLEVSEQMAILQMGEYLFCYYLLCFCCLENLAFLFHFMILIWTCVGDHVTKSDQWPMILRNLHVSLSSMSVNFLVMIYLNQVSLLFSFSNSHESPIIQIFH